MKQNHCTGCPKKKGDKWKIVTEGHWVELEKKVGSFLKNSGNFQSYEHKNFNILSKKEIETEAQRCLPSLKIITIFGAHPVLFFFQQIQ